MHCIFGQSNFDYCMYAGIAVHLELKKNITINWLWRAYQLKQHILIQLTYSSKIILNRYFSIIRRSYNFFRNITHCQSYNLKGANLTHWGRVKHICIGSDNGVTPDRRQTIIWISVVILLIGPLGTTLNIILIGIYKFPFKKMCFKMSSRTRRPFCLGVNV